MKMTVNRGMIEFRNAHGILRKYWEPRVVENVRNMKVFKDGTGVVFDIKSENFEAFIDNYERLKEIEARLDFEIQKCNELPDLEDVPGYTQNQNWRELGKDNYGQYGKQPNKGYQKGGYQDRSDWGGKNSSSNYIYGGKQSYNDDSRAQNWRDQDNSMRGGG